MNFYRVHCVPQGWVCHPLLWQYCRGLLFEWLWNTFCHRLHRPIQASGPDVSSNLWLVLAPTTNIPCPTSISPCGKGLWTFPIPNENRPRRRQRFRQKLLQNRSFVRTTHQLKVGFDSGHTYVIWIAAERWTVFFDPFHCHALIFQSRISRNSHFRIIEIQKTLQLNIHFCCHLLLSEIPL